MNTDKEPRIPLTAAEFNRRCAAAEKLIRLALHDLKGLKAGGYDTYRSSAFTDSLFDAQHLISDYRSAWWKEEARKREAAKQSNPAEDLP